MKNQRHLRSGIITGALAALLLSSPALGESGLGVQADPDWGPPVKQKYFGQVMFDRLEIAAGEGPETLNWEAQAWYGGDINRVWFETEGDQIISGGKGGELESADLLYGRQISPFWEARIGPGYQRHYGPGPDSDRFFAVAGFQGMAPYWIETGAKLRLSDDGDVSVHAELEYDALLTQRLVLQPRVATGIAFQDVPEFETGAGITGVTTGLRLRYEVTREFAPYIGVTWQRSIGQTADLVKDEGGDTSQFAGVVGIRMWF